MPWLVFGAEKRELNADRSATAGNLLSAQWIFKKSAEIAGAALGEKLLAVCW